MLHNMEHCNHTHNHLHQFFILTYHVFFTLCKKEKFLLDKILLNVVKRLFLLEIMTDVEKWILYNST